MIVNYVTIRHLVNEKVSELTLDLIARLGINLKDYDFRFDLITLRSSFVVSIPSSSGI